MCRDPVVLFHAGVPPSVDQPPATLTEETVATPGLYDRNSSKAFTESTAVTDTETDVEKDCPWFTEADPSWSCVPGEAPPGESETKRAPAKTRTSESVRRRGRLGAVECMFPPEFPTRTLDR